MQGEEHFNWLPSMSIETNQAGFILKLGQYGMNTHDKTHYNEGVSHDNIYHSKPMCK